MLLKNFQALLEKYKCPNGDQPVTSIEKTLIQGRHAVTVMDVYLSLGLSCLDSRISHHSDSNFIV